MSLQLNCKSVALLLLVIVLAGVPVYANEKWADEARKLVLRANETDTVIWCNFKSVKCPVSVEFGDIPSCPHIGVNLFDKNAKESSNKQICDFIERLSLKLILFETKKEEADYLKRADIKLQINNLRYDKTGLSGFGEVVALFDPKPEFAIEKKDRNFVVALFARNSTSVIFEFPVSRELISGLDKKESDLAVMRILTDAKDYTHENYDDAVVTDESMLEKWHEDTYIKRGEMFYAESINNDSFYSKISSGQYVPLFSEQYPVQSLKNVFQNVAGIDFEIDISHRVYGNKVYSYAVGLKRIMHCFEKDFKVYSGVNKRKNGILECVVVFHNYMFEYIHMLVMNIDPKNMYNLEQVKARADFYSNIPQHNIKDFITL